MGKVFPSVSKKDEALYARLETSLRRTRSHITDVAPGATEKPSTTAPNGTNTGKRK